MRSFVITFIALFSLSAYADLECRSAEAPQYRIITKGESPAILQVEEGGKVIHKKAVVVSYLPKSVDMMSPQFMNKRRATASLFLSVYQSEDAKEILAIFSEGSFLPVVPNLQLTCQRI